MKHRRRIEPSPFESGTWSTDSVPCPPDPALAAHVDGELDAARSAAVEAHLDRCRICDAEARRLEGLSHLLRAWDVAHPEVVPPPRLASRILREVEVESGVRRRETLASFRRIRAKAAAAALVIGLGATLGARGSGSSEVSSARGEVPVGPVLVARAWTPAPPLVVGAEVEARAAAGLSDAARADGLGGAAAALSSRGETADLSALSDPATKEVFARFASLLETSRRVGEECLLLPDGRAIPVSAVDAWQGMSRWRDWMGERLRRASEPPTRDAFDVGVPLSRVLSLPPEGGVTAFWDTLSRVEYPATRRHGGLVLRALPAPVGVATAGGVEGMSDLSEAVRAGTVRLLEDLQPSPESVVVQVMGLDSPVLVPAGELLSGGLVSRVVARGAWLPAGSDTYQVKLSCRAVGPLARPAGAARPAPAPTGLLAGPELRGALARGETAEGVLAIVRAQLRGAALDGDSLPADLLRLYGPAARQAAPQGSSASSTAPAEADPAAAPGGDLLRRARDLVSRLGDDARGFVATDPNGRLQGTEGLGIEGPAGKALLSRLVAGYLAEACVRSSADGPRLGVHAESVLSVLASRPVRLTPLSAGLGTPRSLRVLVAEEPRTGIVFEALTSDSGAVVLSSGLVPDVR